MEKHIYISIRILKTAELNSGEADLRNAAIDAASRAYAPYSGFQVGAAVLLENRMMFEGNNQENVAYPSGMCAERVALFAAGASCPDTAVEAIAIAAFKNGEMQDSISPCGACRQVLLETENRYQKPVKIYLCGKDETVVVSSAKDLLPLSFGRM
ncbi:MAG: cytidine deaminase [Tannerella sp.]|jgi:cytidine deaminase|nr:cytidine deaminase [Tannerella sp.]